MSMGTASSFPRKKLSLGATVYADFWYILGKLASPHHTYTVLVRVYDSQLFLKSYAQGVVAIGDLCHHQYEWQEKSGWRAVRFSPERADFEFENWNAVWIDRNVLSLTLSTAHTHISIHAQSAFPSVRLYEDNVDASSPSHGWAYREMQTSGVLVRHGHAVESVTGTLWYEYGNSSLFLKTYDLLPYDCMHIFLYNGSSLCFFLAEEWALSRSIDAVFITPSNERMTLSRNEFIWQPRAYWESPVSGVSYPVAGRFQSRKIGCDLMMSVAYPGQEIPGRGPLSERYLLAWGYARGTIYNMNTQGDVYFHFKREQRLLRRLIAETARVIYE